MSGCGAEEEGQSSEPPETDVTEKGVLLFGDKPSCLDLSNAPASSHTQAKGALRPIPVGPGVPSIPYVIRPPWGELTDTRCEELASMLRTNPSRYIHLDLSRSSVKETGAELLIAALQSPDCRLVTLRLGGCVMSKKSWHSLGLALMNHSSLRLLDLSENKYLTDSVLKMLFDRLSLGQCRPHILRLVCCNLTESSCDSLALLLKSPSMYLKELDLSSNQIGDSGLKKLCAGLSDSQCRLRSLRLMHCDFSDEGCASLVSALKSNRFLTELDLSGNELQHEGMKLLSDFVSSPGCRLETLRVDKGRNLIKHTAYTGWFKEQDKSAAETRIAAAGIKHGLSKRRDRETESELFASHDKATEKFQSISHAQGPSSEPFPSHHKPLPLAPVFGTGGNFEATKAKFDFGLLRTDLSVKQVTQVPSHFTPTVFKKRGNISYRFRGPCPGVYKCELTGLMFTMTGEGELSYRIVQWDREFLQLSGKVAAGPLYDIKCPEATVSQLHLPHCETKPALLSGCLSIVHVSDDGKSFTEPLQITETHVVVDVPHLSAFGLVWDIIKRFLNIQEPILGQVHLFYNPKFTRKSQKINVFLLTENVPLQEVKEQQKDACAQNSYFEAPSTCYLIKDQTYAVHCPEALLVQPDFAPFIFNYGPNYSPTFELRLSSGTEEATVTVQNQEKTPVWKHQLDLTSLTSASSSAVPLALLPVPGGEQALSSASAVVKALSSFFTASELAGGQGPDPNGQNPQRTGVEEMELSSVRTAFINRVSNPVLNNLLDVLLQHEVINNSEMESIQTLQRENKARQLIQMVLNKGNHASVILTKAFCEADPFLSEQLRLNTKNT